MDNQFQVGDMFLVKNKPKYIILFIDNNKLFINNDTIYCIYYNFIDKKFIDNHLTKRFRVIPGTRFFDVNQFHP